MQISAPILTGVLGLAGLFSGSLAAQTSSNRPQMVKALGSYGIDVGRAGIVNSTTVGLDEVFLSGKRIPSAGGQTFWQALRFDPPSGGFVQTYISPAYATEVVYLGIGDVHPNPGDELLVVQITGEIHVHDQATKERIAMIDTGISPVNDFKHADLDDDGFEDYLILGTTGTHLLEPNGIQIMNPTNMTGNSLVVGQMDSDPGLEVATTQGWILDLNTRQFQGNYAAGFGSKLNLSDVDGDGMEELIYIKNDLVWAFDVDLLSNQWWLSVQRARHVLVADSNDDGTDEIIVSAESDGHFHAYDLTTQTFLWTILNPESSASIVAMEDFDRDGRDELAFGAGFSADSQLHIANLRTGSMEWIGEDLAGPFLASILADVDGDGVEEVVTASAESRNGYGGGRLVVLEQGRFAPHFSAEAVGSRDVRALQVYDLDGDGDMEILVGGGKRVEAYDYAPGGVFTLLHTILETNDDDVYSLDVGDFDGDGSLEIMMGVGGNNVNIVRYDYATGIEEWRSLQMGTQTWNQIRSLQHGDLDGDGQDEIAAMLEGDSCYVYSTTGTLEAAFFGDFHGMQFGTAATLTPRPLRFGGDDGVLTQYLWNGSSYAVDGTLSLFTTPIDGFSPWTGGRLWIGTNGVLNLYEIGTGSILWSSQVHELGFGSSTMELDSGEILTTGHDGIFVYGIR